ncbi:hypothetical protein DFH27DRAFT_617089 [Peziza echinospora]|nr:hypothetical protein DFH27DRAFT_617089 [Peziza echinospora]
MRDADTAVVGVDSGLVWTRLPSRPSAVGIPPTARSASPPTATTNERVALSWARSRKLSRTSTVAPPTSLEVAATTATATSTASQEQHVRPHTPGTVGPPHLPRTPPSSAPLPPTPPDSAAKPQGGKPTAPLPLPPAAPHAPLPAAPLQPPPPALRLDDFTPAQLSALRPLAPETPLLIRNVTPEALYAWLTQHRVLEAREDCDALPYEYNATTQDFIVKCMPSPYHSMVGTYFAFRTSHSLMDILPPASSSSDRSSARRRSRRLPRDPTHAYTSLGISLCNASESTGFSGLPRLSSRSRKIPDFSLRLGPLARFPAMVVEVGFTEPWAQLVQDVALHLLATKGVTRVAVVIKLQEGRRGGAGCTADVGKDPYAWPACVEKLSGGEGQEEVARKVEEVEAWLVAAEGGAGGTGRRAGLVGSITGTARVYVRTSEQHEFPPQQGTLPCADGDDEAAQATSPGITCVYRYQFMRDDEVLGPEPGADEQEAGGEGEPWILSVPLKLLCPPTPPPVGTDMDAPERQQITQINPILHAQRNSPITFDLLTLAEEIHDAKSRMAVWRAMSLADRIVGRWQEQEQERNMKRAYEQQFESPDGDVEEPPSDGPPGRRQTRNQIGSRRGAVKAEGTSGQEHNDVQLMWGAYKSASKNRVGEEESDHDSDEDGEVEDKRDMDWSPDT